MREQHAMMYYCEHGEKHRKGGSRGAGAGAAILSIIGEESLSHSGVGSAAGWLDGTGFFATVASYSSSVVHGFPVRALLYLMMMVSMTACVCASVGQIRQLQLQKRNSEPTKWRQT